MRQMADMRRCLSRAEPQMEAFLLIFNRSSVTKARENIGLARIAGTGHLAQI